jgi:hypothetical protein
MTAALPQASVLAQARRIKQLMLKGKVGAAARCLGRLGAHSQKAVRAILVGDAPILDKRIRR